MKSEDNVIYIFGKNREGKFIFCNEPLAEEMNVDSPSAVIGKTDYQLCWRQYADIYRQGDVEAMQGKLVNGVREKQVYVNKKNYDVVVNKHPLLDKNGEVVGVVGSFVKVPSSIVNYSIGRLVEKDNKIYLGANFGSEYFTKREYAIFKQLLLSKSSKQIANILCLSQRTVEGYVDIIKSKLDCRYKNEIVITAIKNGLVTFSN